MATTTKKNTSSTKTTKTTPKEQGSNTISELEAKIATLEKMIEQQSRIIEMQTKMATQCTTQPEATNQLPSTDITIVYCSDSMGYAKISNMELHFNKYGEEFTMSRYQFDELVGKYRDWFDRGVLAVSSKNIEAAASKGLKTDKELNFDKKTLDSIAKMSADALEKTWYNCANDAQKESIVLFIKRKFIEGDPLFKNREKIDLMNRLTSGGFQREQQELSGQYKITKTEM